MIEDKKAAITTHVRMKIFLWFLFFIAGCVLFLVGFLLPVYNRETCEYINCTCSNSSIDVLNCFELHVCFTTDIQPDTERCAFYYPKELTNATSCPESGTLCWYRTWPDNGVGYPLYTTPAPENFRAPIVISAVSLLLLLLFVAAIFY